MELGAAFGRGGIFVCMNRHDERFVYGFVAGYRFWNQNNAVELLKRDDSLTLSLK